MKDIYKIGIVAGIGLGVIGIMAYFNKQVNRLMDACFTVTGAVINQMSADNFAFTLIMNIKNKSEIDFTVTNQRYNIYINKMLVATIEKPNDIKVMGNGMTTLKIDVKFNPQDLLKQGLENIIYLLGDKKKIVIEIKGYLSLKAGIITVKDYQVDERLSLAELLNPSPKNEVC